MTPQERLELEATVAGNAVGGLLGGLMAGGVQREALRAGLAHVLQNFDAVLPASREEMLRIAAMARTMMGAEEV